MWWSMGLALIFLIMQMISYSVYKFLTNIFTRILFLDMKCLSCDNHFHPQMGFHFLGFNKRQNSIYVYYQLCPSCNEPVIGTYETQKLEFMPPVSSDDINNKVSLLKKV